MLERINVSEMPTHIIEFREENKIKLMKNLIKFNKGSLENSFHCPWPLYKPVIISTPYNKEYFYFIQNM